MDLILDIQEKESSKPEAPTFPQLKSSSTGFPEHKKRRVSAFKQNRQGNSAQTKSPANVFTSGSQGPLASVSSGAESSSGANEQKMDLKSTLDRENSAKLESMSPQEIEQARLELFNGLDSSVLETLLKRANIDEKQNGPSPFDEPVASTEKNKASQKKDPPQIDVEDKTLPSKEKKRQNSKKVTFADSPPKSTSSYQATTVTDEPFEQEQEQELQKGVSFPIDTSDIKETVPNALPSDQVLPNEPEATPKPHWPKPPGKPDIDPEDPDFLESLHTKYFPSLPADPSKLAWMAPIPTPNSPADYDSPYHPSQSSLPVSALRFDFRGTLLPPRISRVIPVSKGLHHHGEAPEAAGYTVAELAKLCRSAVPGQRCLAYQTLGRILYRLGRGEFGVIGDNIADGIWGLVVEGKVMDSLYEEAGADFEGGIGNGRGHRSAHAFAVEAIWLFQKGGWKERVRRGK